MRPVALCRAGVGNVPSESCSAGVSCFGNKRLVSCWGNGTAQMLGPRQSMAAAGGMALGGGTALGRDEEQLCGVLPVCCCGQAVARLQWGSCCMASAGNFSCRDSFALPLELCYIVSFALHCCGWPTVTQELEVLQDANPHVKAARCPGLSPTWTTGSTSMSQPLLSSLRCWKRKQRREDGPCPHMPVDVSDVLTHLPIR